LFSREPTTSGLSGLFINIWSPKWIESVFKIDGRDIEEN
jgi:hypothetical protein